NQGYEQSYQGQDNYQNQNYAQQGYAPQEEYYPQQGYDQGGYDQNYGAQGGFDSSTIIEITEQVILEKTKKINDQLEDLNEFKALHKNKLENIDERLKKIESTIDKLQITILEKIGSYGQNLGEIKKEMNMMQDSFGKVVNDIADKKTAKSIAEKAIQKEEKKVSKK
ncbi:MAG: hypothetical protein OQK82_03250, partial [Candidatus Pacearchaeota archaeon]|nr:hypothetical protein [Candidatus Pacearchaeota archaeon]